MQGEEEEEEYLVVVYGPPGSGKTTTALSLLASLRKRTYPTNGVLVSADCIEEYLRSHPITSLTELFRT